MSTRGRDGGGVTSGEGTELLADAATPSPRSRGARRGRQARMAARAAPATERAVYPGVLGGHYKPLSDADVARIHHAALDILERIGMAEAGPQVTELALAKGATVNERGRLCFPAALVEDLLAGAARDIVLHGRDPRHDLDLSGRRVHYGTGGAAVRVLDLETGRYRASTLVDLYDFARLVDRLDNIHWFTRCVIATELADPLALDLNTVYACLAGTTKHVGTAITDVANVAPVIEMLDMVAGGEGRFRKRPFVKLHASPTVPPLRFGAEACATAIAAAKAGMPINAITAAQSGATAPAALAGTLVQTTAETLAALVMVNLAVPGHPFIFSNWPFVSDLRTGAFSGGGGEEAVLNAASAQIIDFYRLPSGVAAGMTDSKLPDAQYGFEKGMTLALAGAAGANLVYESSGMLASLLGCSFEGFVIDNEMLGFVQRAVRGIEVTEESLSLDVIEQAVNGPGHYLGSAQTLELMQSEYVYPQLGDRRTPDEWEQSGSLDMRERAREQARAILAEPPPTLIDAALDRQIRARFAIEL